MAERLPWFKFNTVAWRGDSRLRDCSLAAQGLWINLMALMHESSLYGHLLINGEPPTDRKIAAQIGCEDVRAVAKAREELETKGVARRTSTGVLYSKRMVEDRQTQEVMSERGKRGGNPKLKPQPNHRDNQQLKPDHKPNAHDTRSGVSGSLSEVNGFGPLRHHPLDTVDGVTPDVETCERASHFLDRFGAAHRRLTGGVYANRPTRDFEPAKSLVATYDDTRLDAITETYMIATGPKFDGVPKSVGRLLDVAGMIDAKLSKGVSA
jgi:hypothetical protein